MMVTKKESRYNAYMKRTESGIIVKTVDSVTGVESLIKFTSDKIVLPGQKLGSGSPKENIRSIVKKSNEANPCVNKKKRYSLSKRNPKIITKLSNPRPFLKEVQPNIPDFSVYEDNSSTLDFQNPQVIFVANSKLAKDSVVNLSIPGKLANVCYHGVLNENGIVKFKAKSVIKPFTIVIGDYVININICHNLISGKDTQNPNQLKNKDISNLSNCSTGNGNPANKEKCTDIRESDIESKTNEIKFDKFTEDCRVKIDETAVISDPSCGRLEERISNENVESAPNVVKNKREKSPELSIKGLESNPTKTENVIAGESLDKSSSEENNHTEENITKLSPSVDLSMNKFTSLSHQSSEYIIKTKGLSSDMSNSHIPKNVNLCERYKTLGKKSSIIRDFQSSVSNSYAFPDDLKSSKMKQSCFSTHSVVSGFETNSVPVHSNLEAEPLMEFNNSHTVEENSDKRPNSRCSNISMIEIKKKLSEASTSLHKLRTVIESIDNFSEKSVSEENIGLHHIEISCESLHTIMQGKLNKSNSNSSTVVIKSRSDENCPRTKRNMNISYAEGGNRLKNKNCVYQACGCANVIEATDREIAISKETEDSSSAEYRTSSVMDQSNVHTDSLWLRDSFGDGNYVLPLSKKIEQKNINTMDKAGNRFTFDGRRQVQSLTNLSESNVPCVDNVYGTGGTSNSDSINYQSKTIPNVLSRTNYLINLQTGEPQGGKIRREFPNKIKRSCTIMDDRIPLPNNYINDHLSSLSVERSFTTCLRYNQELDSGTNLGKESHTSDAKMNSYSTNSIRTLYIKPVCTSSNNLTMPVQHSSMQMFIDDKDTDKVKTNDISFTNSHPSCKEKSSKRKFSQTMKQTLSKLKTHLWKFGSNGKESDLTNLSENSKSNELGIASSSNNISAENGEKVCFAGSPNLLIDLNDEGVKKNIHHEKRDSKTYSDLTFTPCKNCSRILSDIGIKAPNTMNSTQNIINLGKLENNDKLDANCIIDPSEIFLQFSDVSFKK